jgi:hypothetical protein
MTIPANVISIKHLKKKFLTLIAHTSDYSPYVGAVTGYVRAQYAGAIILVQVQAGRQG